MLAIDQLHEIPIELIRRNSDQPRQQFDPKDLNELADSIRSHKIIEPVILRRVTSGGAEYELVSGERRWRAAQIAGCHTVPGIIRVMDDRTRSMVAIIENKQREDLNCIDEAQAFRDVIDSYNLTHSHLADEIGCSRVHITQRLRLLDNTSDYVKACLLNGQLTPGHGRALLPLKITDQDKFAHESIRKEWSVRQAESAVKAFLGSGSTEVTKVKKVDPDIKRLEDALSAHFAAPISLDWDGPKHQGNLQIRFTSLDELDGILDRIQIQFD